MEWRFCPVALPNCDALLPGIDAASTPVWAHISSRVSAASTPVSGASAAVSVRRRSRTRRGEPAPATSETARTIAAPGAA